MSDLEKRITAKMVLDDTGYSSTLKGINSELKNNKAALKAASTGLEAFGKSEENVKRVQESLQKQLDTQSKKVELYKNILNKASDALEKNVVQRDKLKKSIEQEQAKLEALKKTYGSNNDSVRNVENRLEELKEQYEKVDKSIENNAKRIKTYESNLNKAQAEVNKTTTSIKNFNRELENTEGFKSNSKRLEEAGEAYKNFGDKANKLGNTLTTRISLPLIGVGAAAVNVGMNFEEQMDKVSAISGATGDDFNKLEAKAEEMGAKTKFSARDAGEGLEYMAKLLPS